MKNNCANNLTTKVTDHCLKISYPKYYFPYFLLFTNSYIVYGQEYGLLLTENEKHLLNQRILQEKSSESILAFTQKAVRANIPKSKIDSLLFAKEKFLYLKERIFANASQRDGLFLFSENTGTLKRANFNNYRKHLTDILSQEQFYALYKEVIDAKTTLAVQHKINQLSDAYILDGTTKKEIQDLLNPLCKAICLAEDYYIYDKELAQYKTHLLEKSLATKVEEKINSTATFKNDHMVLDSPDTKTALFVQAARAAAVDDSLIVEIVQKVGDLNQQLADIKKVQGVKDPNYLYTPYDKDLNSSEAYRNFEDYLTSVLSPKQYRGLFWEQFSPKIEALAQAKFIALAKKYNLDDIGEKNKKLLKKWIKTFVRDEFVVSRYYFRESSLAEVKVRRIQAKAENKYREVLSKTTDKTIPISESSPRVAAFLANAKTQGIDMKKAQKIVRACLEYELRQEEIMMAKKYNKKYIYSLDNDNGKIRARDAFRRYLADNLTKSEYQKLFWEQLEPEINGRIRAGLAKIKDTYPKIKEKLFEDLRAMLQNQMTMETVARYYYSYDKKLAKQKVKALDYKYNKEYKEKMKQNTL